MNFKHASGKKSILIHTISTQAKEHVTEQSSKPLQVQQDHEKMTIRFKL